jgi:hypothetical protein
VKDLLLQFEILRDRFNNETGVGKFLQPNYRYYSVHGRRRIFLREGAACDKSSQACLHALNCSIRCAGLSVANLDQMAGYGRDLGNARSHGAGPDNADGRMAGNRDSGWSRSGFERLIGHRGGPDSICR